ncbi:NAD(P)H-binding protein [Catelliglobosispora koreensis]|uniref:NAD(P)H-binding protein n=1 Tax=Catelliglobosispora koreensis TaxID=129052 RepID=UPI000590B033|nr:NAD(P)H-binding protein [Catelliglobosispora koreensis]
MTNLKRILVTGASGNIGRHVLQGLKTAGADVTAFARKPVHGTYSITGDFTDPAAIARAADGADSVFLLWPFMSADTAGSVIEILAGRVKRVVYVSAMAVDDSREPESNGVWGQLEHLIAQSGLDYTFLRAGGLAVNALGWADQIKTDSVVRWPYGEAKRSPVHENDVADVALKALLTSDLIGARPTLTGPQVLSQADQVRLIGDAVGREVRWEELPVEDARQGLLAAWGDATFVDAALNHWASIVDNPEPVSHDFEQITGKPARTFAAWAQDHADAFR